MSEDNPTAQNSKKIWINGTLEIGPKGASPFEQMSSAASLMDVLLTPTDEPESTSDNAQNRYDIHHEIWEHKAPINVKVHSSCSLSHSNSKSNVEQKAQRRGSFQKGRTNLILAVDVLVFNLSTLNRVEAEASYDDAACRFHDNKMILSPSARSILEDAIDSTWITERSSDKI